MEAIAIKVVLAIFAFALAILGISDLKSVREEQETAKLPWWHRLTLWGYAKIAIAIITLALGVANELISTDSAQRSRVMADGRAKTLQDTIGAQTAEILNLTEKLTDSAVREQQLAQQANDISAMIALSDLDMTATNYAVNLIFDSSWMDDMSPPSDIFGIIPWFGHSGVLAKLQIYYSSHYVSDFVFYADSETISYDNDYYRVNPGCVASAPVHEPYLLGKAVGCNRSDFKEFWTLPRRRFLQGYETVMDMAAGPFLALMRSVDHSIGSVELGSAFTPEELEVYALKLKQTRIFLQMHVPVLAESKGALSGCDPIIQIPFRFDFTGLEFGGGLIHIVPSGGADVRSCLNPLI